MAAQIEFYLEQAATCAKAAEDAALPNLRDKYLDAQLAWQALADKASHIQAESEKREAERIIRQNEAALASGE